MIYVHKINQVLYQLKNVDMAQCHEITDFFSFYPKNYKWHPKFKAGLWNGKISFFDWNTKTFPISLLFLFKKFCTQLNYEYQLCYDFSQDKSDISQEQYKEFLDELFKDSKIKLRDYQEESVMLGLHNKRGTFEISVGGGKSSIIYSIIQFLLSKNKKCVLIVPNIMLVNQMFNDFKDYGFDDVKDYCSTVFSTSDNIDFNKPIVISTWQSLHKKSKSILEKFDAVLLDETHTLKEYVKIKEILNNCVNAEYRYGFTGTMPKNECEYHTIVGYLGPVLKIIKSDQLIKSDILSDIRIVNLLLQYPPSDIVNLWKDPNNHLRKKNKLFYDIENKFIIENNDRNKAIKYIINNIKATDNVLILCTRISHIKLIHEYLEEHTKGFKIFEIYGEVDAKEREKVRKYVNDNDGIILISNWQTVGTGVNIPKLHHIILSSAYKDEKSVLQGVGRGLRKADNKDMLVLWDLVDDLRFFNKYDGRDIEHRNYMYDHWVDRLGYYKEQNFKFISKKINLGDL